MGASHRDADASIKHDSESDGDYIRETCLKLVYDQSEEEDVPRHAGTKLEIESN